MILDPSKNRALTAALLCLRFARVEETTLVFATGSIKVLPVAIEAPRIVLSRMSEPAREAAPEPDLVAPGQQHERIVVGLVLQRSRRPDSYLQGVINTATGEGVFEDCPSPVVVQPPDGTASSSGKMVFAAPAV